MDLPSAVRALTPIIIVAASEGNKLAEHLTRGNTAHCVGGGHVLTLTCDRQRSEQTLAKKPKKKSIKKRLSSREFSQEFTKIVAGHLESLPIEEQDRRIRAAHRVIVTRFRGAASTKQGVAETRQTPLAARTRE
jgi:hypothetical protein